MKANEKENRVEILNKIHDRAVRANKKPYEVLSSQKEWRIWLRELLQRNDNAVRRATVLLYNYQSSEEQAMMSTREDNKKGFDRNDAPFMSIMARIFIEGNDPDEKDFSITRNKCKRYWKQLMLASKRKMEERKDANRELPFEPGNCNSNSCSSCGQDVNTNSIQEKEQLEEISPAPPVVGTGHWNNVLSNLSEQGDELW